MERYPNLSILKLLLSITDTGGAVDNHNALRHDGGIKSQIGLESARRTTCWPTQVFAFFVACTELNTYLALKYFLLTDETFMKFRGKLAKALIYNLCINGE